MPILTKQDILAAMYLGLVGFEEEPKINATSVDVRIGQLLEANTGKALPLRNGTWLIEPERFYWYELASGLYLAPGFHGRIHSRSSWARYGSASRDADDEFSDIDHLWDTYKGKPICTLKSLGTAFKLRPGDALAQVHLAYEGFVSLRDEQMKNALEQGALKIKRNGKEIEELIRAKIVDGKEVIEKVDENNHFNTGGFTLTSDPVIQVYTGETIDPQEPGNYFERKEATEEGIYLHNKFFLSSSAEEVMIGRHLVGWVQEFNNLIVSSGYKGSYILPDERESTLQTHAAAPKIDPFPIFHGKITFENYSRDGFVFKPGQRITELFLYWLNNPCPAEGDSYSRYKGQKEAGKSKVHKDSNLKQLEFDFK